MNTLHKLNYIVKTPLIQEFIQRIKSTTPEIVFSESCMVKISQLAKGDLFLLDVKHSNDILLLKSAIHQKLQPVVFVSRYEYLRQVLMDHTFPIIFPDFTNLELKIVIEKCFYHTEPTPQHFAFNIESKDMPLTDREIQLLDTLSKGYLYKEIAAKLGISIGTVKQHCHKIYAKLNVSNRTEAINKLGIRMA